MYSFIAMILMIATYIFVVQMQRKRRERSWKWWVIYALLLAVAVYSHYFSILLAGSHLLYALIHDTRTKDGATRLIRLKNRLTLIDRRLLKSYVLVGLLLLPWAPTLLDQFIP